jgi:lysophospholipase L1-like esterase
MKKLRPILALLAFALLLSAAQAQTPAPVAREHPDASAATPKQDTGQFVKRHESFLARAKAGPIGLLFLGDSITDNWSKAPAIWNKYYAPYQPANFGIGGDTTQNVIWRIEHGELDGIHPRVVVLMIGTNNAGSNDAAEIFAADKKIVGMIRTRLPEAKVLLLAIFPRGPRKNRDGSEDNYVERMQIINAVNPQLATLDDGVNVRYLDLGAKFLGPDGKIPDAIMADHLHPTVAGYQIWADAMQPLLGEMMRADG